MNVEFLSQFISFNPYNSKACIKIKNYKSVMFVGDIHGDFDSLCKIIDNINKANYDTVIFLGDYIDRGKDSELCLFTLFNLALNNPKRFIVLAGNHESESCLYISQYYTSLNEQMKSLLLKALSLLPICALIQGNINIFAAHGGLPRYLNYSENLINDFNDKHQLSTFDSSQIIDNTVEGLSIYDFINEISYKYNIISRKYEHAKNTVNEYLKTNSVMYNEVKIIYNMLLSLKEIDNEISREDSNDAINKSFPSKRDVLHFIKSNIKEIIDYFMLTYNDESTSETLFDEFSQTMLSKIENKLNEIYKNRSFNTSFNKSLTPSHDKYRDFIKNKYKETCSTLYDKINKHISNPMFIDYMNAYEKYMKLNQKMLNVKNKLDTIKKNVQWSDVKFEHSKVFNEKVNRNNLTVDEEERFINQFNKSNINVFIRGHQILNNLFGIYDIKNNRDILSKRVDLRNDSRLYITIHSTTIYKDLDDKHSIPKVAILNDNKIMIESICVS